METFEAYFSIIMVICGIIVGYNQGKQKIINNTERNRVRSCSDFFLGIKQ